MLCKASVMPMKTLKHLIGPAVLIISLIITGVVFFTPDQELPAVDPVEGTAVVASPNFDENDDPSKHTQALRILNTLYNSPIDLVGRVEDEEGNPVGHANVEFDLNDKYFKSGTRGKTVAGPDGMFRIQGVGASVWVRVQKEGYFWLKKKSERAIRQAEIRSEQPEIFILKKMGERANLTWNAVERKGIASDGASMGIALNKPRLVPVENAPIQVRVWVMPSSQRYWYPWKAELRIPGGGWIERNDDLAFEAPLTGYQEVLEFSMLKDDENWDRSIGRRNYFFKLANGTYGRVTLNIMTNSKNAMISFYSWWNESGERNLQAGANWFGMAE
jgi:hypothetical protein